MAAELFAEIRAACRAVAAEARHVRIDEGMVSRYARSLPLEQVRAADLDRRYHYLGAPEETVAFILALDAVNFGSGYFPHLRKRPGLSGYFTIAASLTERFAAEGPLTAEELREITARDCARLFGQELDGGPVEELMGLFATAWNDLGRYLGARFGESGVGLVEAAGASAARLVELLIEMPFFRDVQTYHGRRVPLYKRAQLTAADLALAFERQGLGAFGDLEELTIFADNLVPHVLRVDGVLRYDERLAARIDAGEPLPAGSDEEIEIRAVALHAVERLVEVLRGDGQAVTAMELDYLLWNRGQRPAFKAWPRHRTRTVYY